MSRTPPPARARDRAYVRSLFFQACAALLALLSGAGAGAAQQYVGYSGPAVERQARLERALVESIRPEALESLAARLSSEPRVAGSVAQVRSRDYVTDLTRAWGLRSEAPSYRVFLPWADSVDVHMTAPDSAAVPRGEPSLSADPATEGWQYPWVNGYSGTGTAEAEVVYANHGLHEDYAALLERGIDVRDRIVIARYGRSYRGVKARLAQRHGAAALILYSDPRDVGYFRGDVYPDGAYVPGTAAQRGSIMNGSGDPSTPDGPSLPDARRVDGAALDSTLASIPVVPLGYAAAAPILAAIGGAELPDQQWQGALPFRYHVGPGPVRVRVHVSDDRRRAGYKTIWNTVAWLPGAELPDEWIVVGAHRDAWSEGANDNASGTAAVLGAAQALARLARDGSPPRRSILFATWDAEEWGLIGSTEWVEQHAAELRRKVVAYLNQDAVAGGPSFGAGATPSLDGVLHDAARAVQAPDGTGTLYGEWLDRAGASDERAGGGPAVGRLGGGSDHAAFYAHLGVPSAGWGFGGSGSQYHTAYDTHTWMRRFGDPGFRRHAATSRLTAVVALRLANAEVLPLDYSNFAMEMQDALDDVMQDARVAGLDLDALEPVARALRRMGEQAARFAALRSGWLDRPVRDASAADSANARLMRVERTLTRPQGLRGRPWTRNLVFAADARNGYATLPLPTLAEAVRAGDAALLEEEARDLRERLERATAHLSAATRALHVEGDG